MPMIRTLLAAGLLGLAIVYPAAADKSLSVLGYIEYAHFPEADLQLKAKLDTGATTSSINALNTEAFDKDGDEWMRFDVIDPEDEDNLLRFEAPVVRKVRIKRHSGRPDVRPVVLLDVCVGNARQMTQFSLADRSDFNYQVLIGRNFLKGNIVVDSGTRYTGKPDCTKREGKSD